MSTNRSSKNRFIPSFEALESRELMSVTAVTINAGLLRVVCDGGNNNVSITSQSPVVVAKAPAVASGAASLYTITVRDLTKTTNNYWIVPTSSVKTIEIDAGAGNDTIISNAAAPTTVYAGNGNNHVETGAGNDNVFAGAGNNTIITNDGNDIVSCGFGDNTILGGNGNDRLTAAGGSNTIFGGAGDDTISSGLNPLRPNAVSLLFGDVGNDTIVSGNRNDTVDGGIGYDTVNVKAGTNLKNAENVTISVPLGLPAHTNLYSFIDAGNAYLQSYGYTQPVRSTLDNNGHMYIDELQYALAQVKPDTTLVYGHDGVGTPISRLTTLVDSGKPVIIQLATSSGVNRYVVVNGYDSATQTFKYVDGGVQHNIAASALDTLWGSADYSLIY